MSLSGFLLRWIAALVLVLGTYNPTRFSYLDWVIEGPADHLPFKVVVGVLIVVGFVVYCSAAFEALGLFGLLLAVLLIGSLIWWLGSTGLLDLNPDEPLLTWVLLIALATVLAVGMSWAFWRRSIAGQVESTGT
jgi:Family of unknown function (DUF6524)